MLTILIHYYRSLYLVYFFFLFFASVLFTYLLNKYFDLCIRKKKLDVKVRTVEMMISGP
jgi:hypothetical protein